MGVKRPDPRERVKIVMESLDGAEFQTIREISEKSGMKWETVWNYLRLIQYAQSCPKLVVTRELKRNEMWRREWGKIPE